MSRSSEQECPLVCRNDDAAVTTSYAENPSAGTFGQLHELRIL